MRIDRNPFVVLPVTVNSQLQIAVSVHPSNYAIENHVAGLAQHWDETVGDEDGCGRQSPASVPNASETLRHSRAFMEAHSLVSYNFVGEKLPKNPFTFSFRRSKRHGKSM